MKTGGLIDTFNRLVHGVDPVFLSASVVTLLLLAAAVWLILRAHKPLRRPLWITNGRRKLFSFAGLWRGLGAGFGLLAKAVRQIMTRREWRYQVPWILLLGADGSGRESLASSITSSRRDTLSAAERKLAIPGTRWRYFNRGVLIDVDVPPASAAEQRKEAGWSGVVEGLVNLRPERPIDGVVLCFSARQLLHGSAAELHQLAESAYAQLVDLQRVFRFTFPVYVAVTQCDVIDGFGAFWRRQPEARRREMFGWSNPYALDTSFLPGWVDEAFATLGDALKTLQVGAAAGDNDDIEETDRFFLFPQRFRELNDVLRTTLAQVFQSSAYHTNFFLRGLYFTGAVAADGEQAPEPRHDVAFADALFDEKVFAEFNLARPTRSGLLSRHTTIRRLQLGSVVLFGLLCIALAVSGIRLNNQVSVTVHALELIKQPKYETVAAGACIGRDTVYNLLTDISELDVQYTYLAIPASWVDRHLSQRKSKFMTNAAFERVVFPSLRCQLERRAETLLTPPDLHAAAGGQQTTGAMAAQRRALEGYVDEVRDFERNVTLFHQVVAAGEETQAQAIATKFARLADYVYGKPVPEVFQLNEGQVRESLVKVVYATPIHLPANYKNQVSRNIVLAAKQLNGDMSARLDRGADLFQALANGEAPYLPKVRRLLGWSDWINHQWLQADADANPCQAVRTMLDAPLTALTKEYGYPAELGTVSGDFDRLSCFQPAMNRLAALHVAPHGVVFVRQGNTLTMAPAYRAELTGFKALAATDFMQLTPQRSFDCAAPLQGWRPAALAEAASYIRSYQNFENGLSPPQQAVADMPLYERIARLQLEALLEDGLEGAQLKYDASASTVRALISPVSTLDAQLQQQSGDFSQAMDQLVLLLRTMKQMGFDDLHAEVTQCTRDMAGDALQSINALAAASRLYEPEPAASGGDGEEQLFVLGPAAQTDDYLTRQLQRVQVLAGYASPLVSFLLNTEGIDDARRANGETADYWNSTITAINRYVQFKEPNGQVAHLDSLFLNQLAGMTQNDCAQRLDKYQPPVYGNDLFSQRRAALERQAGLLCNDQAEANAFSTYEGVAAEFNRLLAGRYPFGAPYRQEASLAAVKEFFTDYLKQRDALHAELGVIKGGIDSRAQQFLNRLDSVADFMAASLAAGDVSHALTLKFNFRSHPLQSPGSDQLVTWKFAAGGDTVSYPNGGDQLSWQFGEPVALTFDWADQSRFWPQPDAGQDDLHVDGRDARFADGGQWALLRLIQAHLPRSRPVIDPLDADAVVLQFKVPVEVRGSGRAAGRRQKSRMYLSLHLSGVDATGAKQVAIKFPLVFPQYAPTVW